MKLPIKKCPYCGNENEFYTKDYVYGSSWLSQKDEQLNQKYDNLNHKVGKIAYCSDCHRKIYKIKGV